MKDRFNKKVVWITGGGSGLGKAMALDFARQGAMVAVSGRRKDRLEATIREIENAGGQGLAVPCDVAQEQQLIEAVDQITKTFGGLDVAVANAATATRGTFEEMENHDWRRVFEINVFGLAMMVKYALPELRKTKGRLVLIASGASLSVFPGAVIYTASKYAVRAKIMGRFGYYMPGLYYYFMTRMGSKTAMSFEKEQNNRTARRVQDMWNHRAHQWLPPVRALKGESTQQDR